MKPSSINPDVELRDFLQGKISVGLPGGEMQEVAVYGDWERPTNDVPDDFVVIMMNGNVSGLGMNIDYADGHVIVSLYSKLNNDGSVKKNRVKNILAQFDELVENRNTPNYFFKYEIQPFITPTTPNITSGYSITSLNLRWNTNSNFNKPVTP